MSLQEIGSIIIGVALFAIVIYVNVVSAISRRERHRKIKEKYPNLFNQEFEKTQYFFMCKGDPE